MFKYTEIVLLEYTYMSKKISFKFMFKYILLYLSKKSLVYLIWLMKSTFSLTIMIDCKDQHLLMHSVLTVNDHAIQIMIDFHFILEHFGMKF